MSWLFSQALVEEFSEDICLDGEQSVQSSGSNIPQAYCAPDKMTGFSRLSRFGMTYKPLTESRGEELLTLYREAFPAKTSAQLEKEQELMENEAGCGEKWRASFTKYSPDLRLWKTHQCSLLGDLEPFLETWPQWGLMRNGECWEQQTLAQTTRETEFGLRQQMFPTPVKSESHGSAAFKLTDAVQASLGKTMPKYQQNSQKWEQFQNWPSPKTRDWKDGKTEGTSNRQSPDLGKVVGQSKTTGSLNPTWVEWLMGWPLGWTDLKPLAMDKCHFVPQPLGDS